MKSCRLSAEELDILLDRENETPKLDVLNSAGELQACEPYNTYLILMDASQTEKEKRHLSTHESKIAERIQNRHEQMEKIKTILLYDLDKKSEIRKKYRGEETKKKYQMVLELKNLQVQTDSKMREVMSQVQIDAYHNLLKEINKKVEWNFISYQK